MSTQTLSVREASTQLESLVEQAQNTYEPVILTGNDTSEPVAVLVEPATYQRLAKNDDDLLTKRLNRARDIHVLLASQWDTDVIRQAFPQTWRWCLEGIWDASEAREKPFRQLLVLLQMATDVIDMATFNQTHLDAIGFCLDILQKPKVTQERLIDCDNALEQSGLSVQLELDDDFVALYDDEI